MRPTPGEFIHMIPRSRKDAQTKHHSSFIMAETKVQTAIEDFDWEAYENGETAGSKNRQELTNTYDESLKTAKENEVVTSRPLKTKTVSSVFPTRKLARHAAGIASTRLLRKMKSSRVMSRAAPRAV